MESGVCLIFYVIVGIAKGHQSLAGSVVPRREPFEITAGMREMKGGESNGAVLCRRGCVDFGLF